MSLLNLVKRNAGPALKLETAIAAEDVETIQSIIAGGHFGVNDQLSQQTGLSALHVAARLNRPESVRALVRLGADPLLANFLGHTPLFCALHAHAPSALLELARWAPIPWNAIRKTCDAVWTEDGLPRDPFVSFTMHLVVSLMQPLSVINWSIVCTCFEAYWTVVETTTQKQEMHHQTGLSRGLFPNPDEEAAAVETVVSSSPFLLDDRVRPEAILSATVGVYEFSSGIPGSLRAPQAARVSSVLDRLRRLRALAKMQPVQDTPQSLRFICRNAVRRAVNCSLNYVYAIYSLPLDFATKRFLTYQQEVATVMAARPRTRYN